jgi:hypothetical protein
VELGGDGNTSSEEFGGGPFCHKADEICQSMVRAEWLRARITE